MSTKLKKTIKKFIYGFVPYYLCRVFSPGSRCLRYYRYIMANGYKRHLYVFREEYDQRSFPIVYDEAVGLHYVLNRQGRRLYFKRGMLPQKIERNYRELAMEQDLRSPHHYLDDPEEVRGKTLLDVGCAEGFTSLEAVEVAAHIYLFEADDAWIEALKATYAPWHDKVTIVRKYVSDSDGEQSITLDTLFNSKAIQPIFLKMDIEGSERYALRGSRRLFQTMPVTFAICTYHGDDDKVVPQILREYGCSFTEQEGFFRHRLRSVVARGSNRG